jgi:hypothetical protein
VLCCALLLLAVVCIDHTIRGGGGVEKMPLLLQLRCILHQHHLQLHGLAGWCAALMLVKVAVRLMPPLPVF